MDEIFILEMKSLCGHSIMSRYFKSILITRDWDPIHVFFCSLYSKRHIKILSTALFYSKRSRILLIWTDCNGTGLIVLFRSHLLHSYFSAYINYLFSSLKLADLKDLWITIAKRYFIFLFISSIMEVHNHYSLNNLIFWEIMLMCITKSYWSSQRVRFQKNNELSAKRRHNICYSSVTKEITNFINKVINDLIFFRKMFKKKITEH